MALAQALRSASTSCGALAPLLLRAQALCAPHLLGSQGSLAAAAAAPPPPAATALRSLFTSATVAAPASEPAEVRVSELIDAHCGAYGSEQQQASPLQVLEPGFRHFGGRRSFWGQVSTIKCLNSNHLVHAAVKEDGAGRVLVIDAGASMQAAVIGDVLTSVAKKHGWEGIVVNGCVRDAATLPNTPIGVAALGTHPMKPGKNKVLGQRDLPVVVGGAIVCPGDWLYADEDGILVSPEPLELPDAQQLEELRRSYGII